MNFRIHQTLGFARQTLNFVPQTFGFVPQTFGFVPQAFDFVCQTFGFDLKTRVFAFFQSETSNFITLPILSESSPFASAVGGISLREVAPL